MYVPIQKQTTHYSIEGLIWTYQCCIHIVLHNASFSTICVKTRINWLMIAYVACSICHDLLWHIRQVTQNQYKIYYISAAIHLKHVYVYHKGNACTKLIWILSKWIDSKHNDNKYNNPLMYTYIIYTRKTHQNILLISYSCVFVIHSNKFGVNVFTNT